jgi:drug/metabolite transporter (DMT)-like permease
MRDQHLAVLMGVISIVCWGSLATFGKLLVHLPPFYILSISFFLGAVWGLRSPRELISPPKTLLLGVAGYYGYHFFLFYAFRFAPAVEANLINYLWPVLLVLLTPLFFPGAVLRWWHLLGAGTSVLGCVLLVQGKGEDAGGEALKGYALAAGAALTWPLYSILKKKLPPTKTGAVGGFCLGAGVLSLLTHHWLEPAVTLQAHDLLPLILLGLGPFGIAFYAWDLAMARGDARVIGALAYLTPVLSTAGLVLFGGENLTPTAVWAMLLIIGGASAGLLDFLPSKS